MRTVLWFAGSRILFALTAAVHVLVPILVPPGISWGQEREFDAKRELEGGWIFAEWDDRIRPLIIVLGLIGGLLLLKLIIYLVSRLLRFLTDWIHIARFTRKSRRLGTEEANFAGPTANSQLHGSGDTDGAEQRNGHFALQDNLAELEDCRDQERATREDAEKEISRLKEGLEIREAEWVSARAGLEGRVSELAARGDGLRRESESFKAELDQSRDAAGQLEVEKNDVDDKIDRLQGNLAELEDCRDQERATREDAEKEISRLKEGLEIREAEWVSARAGLEGRVSELAARGDALRSELEEGRRTSDEALEAERDSVRGNLRSLLSERDQLFSRLNTAGRDLSRLSAENEALRPKAAEVEEKRIHLEILRARVNELKTQLNEARKKSTSTESALEAKRQAATPGLSRAIGRAEIGKRKSATLYPFHDSIFRSIPMALIVTDDEDRILRWNLQALRLLNLPENEVSGKNLFDADSVFKETVVRQKLRESRVQRKPSRFAIRYKEPEREVIYVVTASPLRVAGGIISGRLLLIERRVRKPALAT